MDPLSTNYDYAALSIQDLLRARDLYHLHLMNKKNVVATAVGYYRIRKKDTWPSLKDPSPRNLQNKDIPRTLGNSEIRPYSWPAILVFVEEWEEQGNLIGPFRSDLVPKTLYLPDGKAVPVCVILAQKVSETNNSIDLSKLNFPRNVISGGFPLLTRVQNALHVASFGCLVSDGHTVYALTNKHVVGEGGDDISTMLNGTETVVGRASSQSLGRVPFEELYPGLPGKGVYVNMDIGLIEVEDVNQWKARVYGIGPMDNIVDIHSNNLTLRLLNQPVTFFGAVTGEKAEGEIQALFYRYKSMGGFEYVSDMLIGPRTRGLQYKKGDEDKKLQVHYGDSGSLVLLEVEESSTVLGKLTEKPGKYHPLGVLWGMHEFQNDSKNDAHPYVLASFLSVACSKLNVDIIRDWNLDQTDTWGKTGHFKVGAYACELVSNSKLSKFLMANQTNIGYTDATLQSGDVVSGKFSHDFVPLADVADIIWRTTRPSDESNHFADVDEKDPAVYGGKSLLELSLASDKNIDIDVWLDFDKKMDAVNPIYKKDKKTNEDVLRPRRGALPFRVWQMYNQMIKSLSSGDLLGFLVAGGTMSHYVGDACQPLHVSYLHHGRNKDEEKVHSDYETMLIDKKMADLFIGVAKYAKKVKQTDLLPNDGKRAAKRVLKLMSDTFDRLPPLEVIDSWSKNTGRGRWDRMWADLGDQTCRNIAEGSRVLAILWQSAWINGNGDAKFKVNQLGTIKKDRLQTRYNDKAFVRSYSLDDTAGYKSVCY